MTIEKSLVQPVPVISAIINADNTGILSINSREEAFTGADPATLRQALMTRVFEVASLHARPVRVSTMDENGLTSLLVAPNGEVEEEEDADTADIVREPRQAAAGNTTVITALPTITKGEEAAAAASVHEMQASTRGDTPSQPVPGSRRALREAESFLTTQTAVQPATRGFRGWLSSIGIRLTPSAEELAERADVDAVSRHWPGTRTIMVVNRKGGANKTPTVKNMAATFARYGGGGVLAYDGNPEIGTLGWRTEQGGHSSTVIDVLDNSDSLLSTDAVSGHMSRYVHHQPADKFDVLRSDDRRDGKHVMTGDEVDLIHRIAAKYYRLIIMDSGNVDRGSDWTRMVAHTNQLVVPTTTIEDRAEAALLGLQALSERDEHGAALAENAVVIVSQWQPGEARMADQIAEGFRPYVRDVVTVPYDPALKTGRIVHDALSPATRRAWLRATAAVARGL